MPKKNKYVIGILILFVALIGIGAILNSSALNSSNTRNSLEANTSIGSSNAGVSQETISQGANTSASGVTTIRHGYLPTNGDALIFIAKEEGFWNKEGLNVELYQFTTGTEAYNALFGNKLDTTGSGTSNPATYIAKGAAISMIGGLMSEGQSVVAKPEQAKELADLNNWKDKKIATVAMSNGDLIYRGSLKKAGIDWKKDVTFLELNSPNAVLEAVKTGKADGGIVWIPFDTLAQQQGLSVASHSYQYFDKHPCCRIALKTDTLNKDRPTYVKFEKGLIKAYKFFSENQNNSVDDIQKYVNVDKDVIRKATWNNYFYASPDPNKHGVVKFYQMMKDSGYINTDVKIEDHIDTTIYKQALDELIKENPNDSFYQNLLSDYNKMND